MGAKWGSKTDVYGDPISEDHFAKINNLADEMGEAAEGIGITVHQTKEKFGTCRVYCVLPEDKHKDYVRVLTPIMKKGIEQGIKLVDILSVDHSSLFDKQWALDNNMPGYQYHFSPGYHHNKRWIQKIKYFFYKLLPIKRCKTCGARIDGGYYVYVTLTGEKSGMEDDKLPKCCDCIRKSWK